MKQTIVFILTTLYVTSLAYNQTTIWSEDFSSYPNCTTTGSNLNITNPANDWTTTYTDCDDAVTCTPAQSYWGVFNGEFRINDIEGGPCTCGTGGTTENYITTESIDISSFSNVSISLSVRYTGSLEAGVIGTCDNSGDIVRVMYSLDGGPFVQVANNGFLTDDFAPNPAICSQSCINGNTLVIRIQGGNKANDENFYIDNILVQGFAGTFQADAGNDDTICPGNSIILNATGGGTYTWNASPNLSCTNCANPLANPPADETFIVTVDQGGCTDADTVTIFVQNIPIVLDLGNDTLICGGPVAMLLDATQPGATYLWQDMSTAGSFNVIAAGTYWVEVTNACGTATDTIHILQENIPTIYLGNDTSICAGAPAFVLDATQTGVTYVWQDGSSNATFNVTQPGMYFVTLTNACGTATDSVLVSGLALPWLNLGNDTLICGNNVNLLLDATCPGCSYIWQDGNTMPTYAVNAAGTYEVTATNSCGNFIDSITIQVIGSINIYLGPDKILCDSSTLLLNAGSPFATAYLWQDGSTAPTFMATMPGVYYVTVTTVCSTYSDTLQLFEQMEVEDVFTSIVGPCGEDSIWLSLQDIYPGVQVVWSNGDTSLSTTYSMSGIHYVTIAYCNNVYTDSFELTLKPGMADELYMPNVFTPNDDGLNDTYKVGGIFENTLSFQASIFDRWGLLIYSSNNPEFEWNGKYKNQPVSSGVYYMVIEMEKECEESTFIRESTHITVFR